MKLSVTCLCLFLCSLCLQAQSLEEQMSSYMRQSLTDLNSPTISLTVVSRDSILFTTRFGTKNDPGEQFYIGSLSKSLTAFAVLSLVQDSLLALDDRVTDLIPGLVFSSFQNEITIRHLLNHTSGISKKDGFRALPTLSEMGLKPFRVHIGFEPGTQHEYSNLNYSLLGLIIERISGLSFEELLRFAVLNKLDMQQSGVSEKNAVQKYQYLGPFLLKNSHLKYKETAIPAGFMLSSANDMANYLITNLNYGRFNSYQVLDSSLVFQMHTPWNESDFGYGMGWKKGVYNKVPFFQHLGSTATSAAAMFIVPEKDLGLILLINSNSLIFSEELAEGLLGILVGSTPKPTSRKELYIRISVLFLLLLFFAHLTYRISAIVRRKKNLYFKKTLYDFLFSLVLFSAIVYFFPAITDIPFIAFLKLQPDIGTLILLSFLSPIIINSTALLILIIGFSSFVNPYNQNS